MLRDVGYVLKKLDWMRAERIWPNGLRYLWTDAFGVVLYVSLYHQLAKERWLDAAERLVADVERVLGRPRGLRIGEAADRDGQYFHYLAMWLFALARLGEIKPEYRQRGIALARDIHSAFVIPGRGVIWKMREDLSGPYPGYGFGAMDAYDGYVSYRMLDDEALASEIEQMRDLMERDWRALQIEQDLGLGMMLWLAHFFSGEPWAEAQTGRTLGTLEIMWVDPPGYFSRAPGLRDTRFAFTNYGVSLGLQAADVWPQRVERLNAYFENWRSEDEYDREAITWVMACTSHCRVCLFRPVQVAGLNDRALTAENPRLDKRFQSVLTAAAVWVFARCLAAAFRLLFLLILITAAVSTVLTLKLPLVRISGGFAALRHSRLLLQLAGTPSRLARFRAQRQSGPSFNRAGRKGFPLWCR